MKRLKYILPLTLTILAGCQSDDNDGPITFDGTNTVVASWQNGRAVSRADGEPLPADIPETIGVTADGYTGWNNVKFVKTDITHDGKPHYDLANGLLNWDVQNTEYYISAYAPWTEGGEIKDEDLPTFSETDELNGDCSFALKPGSRCIQVTLNHRYAYLRFGFALSDKYGKIRDLKIKNMKLSVGENTISSQEGQVLTLPNTDATAKTITISGDKYYLHDYHTFINPNKLGEQKDVLLTVTYDVYDKDNQLTRKDVKSSTTIYFSKLNLAGGSTGLQAGYYYDIAVLIVPAYLYVLSDNDNKTADVVLQ